MGRNEDFSIFTWGEFNNKVMMDRMMKLVTRIWNSKNWLVKTLVLTAMLIVFMVVYIILNIFF